VRLVAAKLGNSPLTAKANLESVLEWKGGTPEVTPGKRLSVDLPASLEWLKTPKGMAEQNQTGNLLRLLNEAAQQQRIT
jgi:hypothetical protein